MSRARCSASPTRRSPKSSACPCAKMRSRSRLCGSRKRFPSACCCAVASWVSASPSCASAPRRCCRAIYWCLSPTASASALRRICGGAIRHNKSPTRSWGDISRAPTMRSSWSCATLDKAMNKQAIKLSEQYAAALCRYLARQQESSLQQAYELGREAIVDGLGVLDVARIHQRALAASLTHVQSAAARARTFRAAEVFFMETLSPFEAAHRGFREANGELHLLNAKLEQRNAELDALNHDLRNLSKQILHVQEEERKRISRELHDEIGQALTAIDVNLPLLQRDGAASHA